MRVTINSYWFDNLGTHSFVFFWSTIIQCVQFIASGGSAAVAAPGLEDNATDARLQVGIRRLFGGWRLAGVAVRR